MLMRPLTTVTEMFLGFGLLGKGEGAYGHIPLPCHTGRAHGFMASARPPSIAGPALCRACSCSWPFQLKRAALQHSPFCRRERPKLSLHNIALVGPQFSLQTSSQVQLFHTHFGSAPCTALLLLAGLAREEAIQSALLAPQRPGPRPRCPPPHIPPSSPGLLHLPSFLATACPGPSSTTAATHGTAR